MVDGGEQVNTDEWFLDTGATNHMSGACSAFAELDTGVMGTVKFGDGLVVELKGRGTVVFQCKNGNHRLLEVVYYIPRLRKNIISVGRLDAHGYDAHIRHGVFTLRDPSNLLLANEEKVLKLKKALYGLKQAPRAWYAKLDSSLGSLNFSRSNTESAVYMRGEGKSRLIVGVYVDDLIITGAEAIEIAKFKQQMQVMFKMSNLGLLSYYLDMEVKQDSDGITMPQSVYATKILQKAVMEDCNSCQVPMEVRLKLSKEGIGEVVDATQFGSLIESMRYLVNTWPDLSYSVGYISRFMEKPMSEHWAAMKHVLRYLAGTLNLGIRFGKGQVQNPRLIGYSDSDMAGDIDDRKSTTGVLFKFGENLVTWQSQKQKVVALSSCEAEYIAATTVACQGIWLAHLIGELQGEEPSCAILNVDNKSAITLCKNPVLHDRSKHIDTRFHFIREQVEQKKIEVEYIRTEEQLADILTKPLGKIRFLELRGKLGMVQV